MTLEQVMAHVHPEPMSGCWLWDARTTPNGYGQAHINERKRTMVIHKALYELERGPVPAGLQLDHKCRVRNCVNPDHVEPVTCSENNRRGLNPSIVMARNKAITHCPQGHEFTPENTIMYRAKGKKSESRYCRACKKIHNKTYRIRQREMAL